MRNLKWGIVILLLVGAVLAFFYNENNVMPNSVPPEEVTPVPAVSAPETSTPKTMPETKLVEPHKKPTEAPAKREVETIAAEKPKNTNTDSVNLEEYEYSIKKPENRGVKLAPGVTVKSGTVHITQDEHSDKSVEIERNPQNSNNDYQVMWKKKF